MDGNDRDECHVLLVFVQSGHVVADGDGDEICVLEAIWDGHGYERIGVHVCVFVFSFRESGIRSC